MPESLDEEEEECQHEYEYTNIVYMGTEHDRWTFLCIHCDREDDSESYYGD